MFATEWCEPPIFGSPGSSGGRPAYVYHGVNPTSTDKSPPCLLRRKETKPGDSRLSYFCHCIEKALNALPPFNLSRIDVQRNVPQALRKVGEAVFNQVLLRVVE